MPQMPSPSVAAITMVRDEGPMLRRWVDYYGSQLGPSSLVVLDDGSTDGSTDDLPCAVIRLPTLTKQAFEPSRMGLLSGLAQSLLHAYDAVLFADADEFVVADPDRYENLVDYVAQHPDTDVSGVVGLNVVHHGSEPDLDLGRPLLEQRRYAKFLPIMCKPALKRVPAAWRWASHGIMAPYAVDPGLFMFHMKFADRRALKQAGDRRRDLVGMDGRAASSSWRLGGDRMVSLLDAISASTDLSTVRPFRIRHQQLREVVQGKPDGSWRATGGGQVQAMTHRPLVALPDRFRKSV